MSLSHALLGLISYQPSTGYELRTIFSQSVQFFWSATLPQIYRTLNQMESQGWLTFKIEPQEGKPSRKVYTVTDKGMKELKRWLVDKPKTAPEKDPLLLKVFFGRMIDPEALRKIIAGCREHHTKLIEQYESEIVNVIHQYAETCSSPEDAAFWKLTLDFGQGYSKMVIEWCDHVLEMINQLTPLLPTDVHEVILSQGGVSHGTPRGVRKGKEKG